MNGREVMRAEVGQRKGGGVMGVDNEVEAEYKQEMVEYIKC